MAEGMHLALWSMFGALAVVLLYPLLLLLHPHRKQSPSPDPTEWPTVELITAARNASDLLAAKIVNFQALSYPPERLTWLIVSDASTDDTRGTIQAAADPRIRLIERSERGGKAVALNAAVAESHADLLLFSDADSLLAPEAVKKLVRHFTDPSVGGVCGLRRSSRDGTGLREAQQSYIDLDSRLRVLESAQGCISSNDGKIHMIRRFLFRPMPPDVSDDLQTLLNVVSQGYRFVFEPEAVATIRVPARNVRHELLRRRRVVLLSLTAVFRMPHLLHPGRFGWFAVGLLVNKIGRRLLPFLLLTALAGLLWAMGPVAGWVILGAVLVLSSMMGVEAMQPKREPGLMRRWAWLPVYVLAGLTGTAWGGIDFILGRRLHGWEPEKTMENGCE